VNPLSAIFGAGVRLRNALYDRGTLSARRLARPVVSVGNISVGGSGKTPFVIALGELLKQRGIAFDVLSRGYGRNSTEIAVVEPGGTAAQFGDEPLLIAQKLGVPVIVGADRYQAGLLAEKQFPARLHLLDDGFQHRRLHRDFDVVLLPREDFRGSLLPFGRLREPISSLRRADAIVLSEPLRIVGVTPEPTPEQWPVRRVVSPPDVRDRMTAFCGIARARQFFTALRELGHDQWGALSFRDHHRYQQADIDRLLRLRSRAGATAFITTEKDLINLGPLAAQLQPLHVAGLRIELEQPEKALRFLLRTIETRSGCRL
jgi:tetraacyldisaccharide 4'-kinase